MPARSNKNTTTSIAENFTPTTTNTAKLLQKIARELYQRNLDIRKEETRLDELLNSVAEIVFAVDQDYKISLFNKISEAIWGVSEYHAVGKQADFFIKIYDYKTNERIFIDKYAFKQKLYSIPKVKIYVARGNEITERYFALKSNYVDLDHINREAIVSLADITKEVEIEKYKDDFISIASHELKTPISILKNNIWMLKNKSNLELNEQRSRYIKQVEDGIERLRILVTELLNVSKVDQNKLVIETKAFSADDLIHEAIAKYTETFTLKHIQTARPIKSGVIIMTDQLKFGEIMDNYISNAIKYSNPEHPVINITTERSNDKFLKINIKDNGYGIAETDKEKIFTKFGRATAGLKMSSPGSSTGLGLYIVKGYVEAMGGQVGYDTKIGEGTNFWFTTPLAIKV